MENAAFVMTVNMYDVYTQINTEYRKKYKIFSVPVRVLYVIINPENHQKQAKASA